VELSVGSYKPLSAARRPSKVRWRQHIDCSPTSTA